ncbi:MAG: HPr family phosphocarrier protein [Pirellulales bacterium]|nr:HPr family phosphocarrier protein [Pirellulales bacterium]
MAGPTVMVIGLDVAQCASKTSLLTTAQVGEVIVKRNKKMNIDMSQLTQQSKTVVIQNPQGLHARPASLFVNLAQRFHATIEVVKEENIVDGKSILSILTLAATMGTELTIRAEGEDAQSALDALVELIDQFED